MTDELFLNDSYVKEFEARVVKLGGREVILDRTAFYPGGGGQPAIRRRSGSALVRRRWSACGQGVARYRSGGGERR